MTVELIEFETRQRCNRIIGEKEMTSLSFNQTGQEAPRASEGPRAGHHCGPLMCLQKKVITPADFQVSTQNRVKTNKKGHHIRKP